MNKLASIYFLEKLGLCRTPVHLIIGRAWERDLEGVYSGGQWVVRCGERPNMTRKAEAGLPWTVANNFDELLKEIRFMKREASDLLVFAHPQREMNKAGNLLIAYPGIIVEGCFGPYMRLNRLSHGREDPDARYRFRPGMLVDYDSSGIDLFNSAEIYDITRAERKLPWKEFGALTRPVSLEFSVDAKGKVDFHDVFVV